jgi:hypothetical protein
MQLNLAGPYAVWVVSGFGKANCYQEGDVLVLYKMSEEEIQAERDARTSSTLESEKKKRAETSRSVAQHRDLISELQAREQYIGNIPEFHRTIATDELVHFVTGGGARPNPGSALVWQNGAFTMFEKHFAQATNNTMELRAVFETLNCVQQGMTVLVSSDSQYVRHGITQWIH